MHVEKALPLDWSGRLDELSELEDGWIDGTGRAITPAAFQTTESILFGLFEEGVPQPGIFPTVEGGLHLEWTDEKDTEILVSDGGNATLYSDDLEDEGFLAEPPLIVRLAAGALHHLLTAIDAEMDRLRAEEDRCQTAITTWKKVPNGRL